MYVLSPHIAESMAVAEALENQLHAMRGTVEEDKLCKDLAAAQQLVSEMLASAKRTTKQAREEAGLPP